MWHPNSVLTIQNSIDKLAIKFTDLFNSHQNVLLKSQQEYADVLNQENALDSSFYTNLCKDHESLQKNLEHLYLLEKSYKKETGHLKDLIMREAQNSSSKTTEDFRDTRDPVSALKANLSINFSSLQTQVFSCKEVERLELNTLKRLRNYFDEAYAGVENALGNFSSLQRKLQSNQNQASDVLSQVDRYCSSNFMTLKSVNETVESVQEIIANHFDTLNSFNTSYKQQSETLQTSLSQIRQKLYYKTKESHEPKRASSALRGDRHLDQTLKPTVNYDQKDFIILDQLVTQVIATNAYKNEVFAASNKAMHSLQNKLEDKLSVIIKNVHNLQEGTHSLMDQLLFTENKNTRNKSRSTTPVKRAAQYPTPEETSLLEKSRQKNSVSPVINNYMSRTSPGEERKEKSRKYSPSRSKSPETLPTSVRNKSASADKKSSYKVSDYYLKKSIASNKMKEQTDLEKLVRSLKKEKKYQDSYVEKMDLKLQKLETHARKLLASSVRIAGLLGRRNEEEIYALKIYQHDYKLLEETLNQLYNIHDSFQELKLTPVRSTSQEMVKNKSRSLKKLNDLQNSAESLKNERRFLENYASGQKGRASLEEIGHGIPEIVRLEDGAEGPFDSERYNERFSHDRRHAMDVLKWEAEKDDSYINQTLETYEDVWKERDRLKEENQRLYEEMKEMNEDQRVAMMEKRIGELLQEIEKHKQENGEMYKKLKVARAKADERKKTLKQLFDLVMEKDKEINIYKEALKGKSNSGQKRKEDLGKIIENKANDLNGKYRSLEKTMHEKEYQLKKLEDLITVLCQKQENDLKKSYGFEKKEKSQSFFKDDSQREGRFSHSEKRSQKPPQWSSDAERRQAGKSKETIKQPEFEQLENKFKSATDLKGRRDEKKSLRETEERCEVLQAEKRKIEEKYAKALAEMRRIQEQNKDLELTHKKDITLLKDKVKKLSLRVHNFEPLKPEAPKHSQIPAELLEPVPKEKTLPKDLRKTVGDVPQNKELAKSLKANEQQEILNSQIVQLSQDLLGEVEEFKISGNVAEKKKEEQKRAEDAKKIQDLVLENVTLKKLNHNLRREIEELAVLTNEVDKKRIEENTRIENLVHDNEMWRELNRGLQEEVKRINEGMKELEGKIVEESERNEKIGKENQAWKDANKKLESELISLKTSSEEAGGKEKLKTEELEGVSKELLEAKNENNRLNDEMKRLNEEKSEFEKRRVDDTERLKGLIMENQALKEANKQLKEEYEKMQFRIGSSETEKVESGEIVNKLEQENKMLRGFNNSLTEEIRVLKEKGAQELKVLSEENRVLKEENQSLKEQHSSHEVLRSEENRTLVSQMEKIKNGVNEVFSLLRVEECEEIECDVQIEKLKELLKEKETQKRQDLESVEERFKEAHKQAEKSFAAEKQNLEKEIREKQNEITQRANESESLISGYKDVISSKDNELLAKGKEIENLNEKLRFKNAEVKAIELDNEGLLQRINEMDESRDTFEKAFSFSEKRLQTLIVKYMMNISTDVLEKTDEEEDKSVENMMAAHLDQLELNLEGWQVEVDELRRVNSEIEKERDLLVDEKVGLEQRVVDIETAITRTTETVERLEIETKTLNERNSELLELKGRLEEELEKRGLDVHAVEVEMDALKEKINVVREEYRKMLDEMEEERKGLQSQVDQLEKEREEKDDQLKTVEVREAGLLNEKEELEKELQEKNEDLKKLEKDLEMFKETLNNGQTENLKVVEDLKMEIRELEKTLNDLKKEKETQEKKSQENISKLESSRNGLEVQMKDLEKEVQKLKKNLDEKQNEVENNRHEFEQEIKSLKKKHKDEVKSIQVKMAEEEENAKKKEAESQEKITELVDQKEKLEEAANELKSKIKELEIQQESKQNQLEEIQKTLKTVEQEKENAVKDLEKKSAEVNKLEMILEGVSAERDSLKEETERNEKNFPEREKNLQDQLIQLNNEKNALEKELQKVIESEQQQKEELENSVKQISSLQENVIEKEARLEEIERLFSEKEKYAKEVEVRCQGLTAALEGLGEQRRKLIHAKSQEKLKLEHSLKEMKEELNKANEEKEKTRRMSRKVSPPGSPEAVKTSEYEEKIENLEAKEKDLVAENEELKEKLSQQEEMIKELKKHGQDLQDALANAGKRMSQLVEEKEEDEQTSESSKEDNEDTVRNEDGEIEKLSKERDSLAVELEQIKEIVKELEKERKETKEELEEKTLEVERLRKEIEEVRLESQGHLKMIQIQTDEILVLNQAKDGLVKSLENFEKDVIELKRLQGEEKNNQANLIREQFEGLTRENEVKMQNVQKSHQEEIGLLQNKIHELENSLNETQAALGESKGQEVESGLVKAELDKLKTELQNKNQKIGELRDSFLKETDLLEKENETLKSEISNKIAEIEELENGNSLLKEDLVQLEKSMETVQSTLKQEIQGLTHQIEELQKSRKEDEEKLQGLQIENDKLAKTLDERDDQIVKLRRVVQLAKDDSAEIGESSPKELSKLQQENTKLLEKIQAQEERLIELHRDNQNLHQTLEENTGLTPEDQKILEDEIERLTEEIKRKDEDIAYLSRTVERNETLLEEKQKELDSLQVDKKKEVKKDDQDPEASLQREIEHFRTSLKDKDLELQNFRNLVDQKEKDIQESRTSFEINLKEKETQISELAEKLVLAERARRGENNEDEQLLKVISLQEGERSPGKTMSYLAVRPAISSIHTDERKESPYFSPNEFDDMKAQSYLETVPSDERNVKNNRSSDLSHLNEQEYIRTLQEKTRNLQDENDRLELENTKLKSEQEISKVVEEDLRNELLEKEEDIERMQTQMVILKQEITKSDQEKILFEQSPTKMTSDLHQTELIKTTFIKFIEGLLQGKDVEDLLKLLCSLLEINETSKNQLLTGFRAKTQKKGVLKKLF